MSGGNTRDTNTAGALQNAKRSRSTAATARNDTAATSTAAGPSSPPQSKPCIQTGGVADAPQRTWGRVCRPLQRAPAKTRGTSDVAAAASAPVDLALVTVSR